MEKITVLETWSVIKHYRQYDTVITAVNRASIRVHEGEFVAIIGESGSGKSTLLHICAGLDAPNGGRVVVHGRDIYKMSAEKLTYFRGRFIGIIFQNHNLIPTYTALENILVPIKMSDRVEGLYEDDIKRITQTLKIDDRLQHLPSELSGGQQQRVAIARALVNRPEIIFADEPTGNLDRDSADEVLSLLLETKNQVGRQSLIIITHDMSIAERADRIYKMENGELELFRDYI